MNRFRSALWNTRNNLGIGAASAAQACNVTMACYIATERADDSKRSATYAKRITAEHGLPCSICGMKCALFVEERATSTTRAFMHCGCFKATETT